MNIDDLTFMAREVVDAHRALEAFYRRGLRGEPHESVDNAKDLMERRDHAIDQMGRAIGYPPPPRGGGQGGGR